MNNKTIRKIFICKKISRKPIKENKPRTIREGKANRADKIRIRFKSNGIFKNGRWNCIEHEDFINSCLVFGNNWKKIQEVIKTRSRAQIRSHAQKYINKLCKKYKIRMIPRNLRKKGKVLIDEYGHWFNFKNCNVNVIEHEKKILEIFNHGCLNIKSKKGKHYLNEFYNKKPKILLIKNRVKFIKNSKMRQKKVFKILKNDKYPHITNVYQIQQYLKETIDFNKLLLDDYLQENSQSFLLLELLQQKYEFSQLIPLCNENLNIIFKNYDFSSINFFNSMDNFQKEINDKLKSFYQYEKQQIISFDYCSKN